MHIPILSDIIDKIGDFVDPVQLLANHIITGVQNMITSVNSWWINMPTSTQGSGVKIDLDSADAPTADLMKIVSYAQWIALGVCVLSLIFFAIKFFGLEPMRILMIFILISYQ